MSWFEHNVTILHNVNAFERYPGILAQYKPVFGYSSDLLDRLSTEEQMVSVAERAFTILNGAAVDPEGIALAGLYYAAGNRSLSVSDIVLINNVGWLCESVGWKCLGTYPALNYVKEN